MINLLIADDHELIRQGIRRLLETVDDITIVDEAKNGLELLVKLKRYPPDALVLDFSMPGISQFDLIKRVRLEYAHLPVLVLTSRNEETYAVRAIRAGANGYLMKDKAGDELVAAIRKIVSGRPYISTVVAEQLAAGAFSGTHEHLHTSLSNREMQVLELIVLGKSTRAAADELHISVSTVTSHRANIMAKLGLETLPQLVNYALEYRLFSEQQYEAP